jgi:hypothetical protein
MTLPELPLKVGQAIGALMQFAADDGAAECNEWSAITNSIRDELVAAIREWGASLPGQDTARLDWFLSRLSFQALEDMGIRDADWNNHAEARDVIDAARESSR